MTHRLSETARRELAERFAAERLASERLSSYLLGVLEAIGVDPEAYLGFDDRDGTILVRSETTSDEPPPESSSGITASAPTELPLAARTGDPDPMRDAPGEGW